MLLDLSHLSEKYSLDIKGIIHIGAHFLEEKKLYDSLGKNDVIWIEGNPDIYNEMKHKHGNNCQLYNTIISNSVQETIKFHLTSNSQSSSIFKLGSHKYFYSKIVPTKTISIPNTKLEFFIKNNIKDPLGYNFLNLDIQGAELDAIKSSNHYLNNFDYIYSEVNISHLYENCPLLSDIDKYLFEKGLIRKELKLTNEGWGDAFYIRQLQLDKDEYLSNYNEALLLESKVRKKEISSMFLYPIKKLKHLIFND